MPLLFEPTVEGLINLLIAVVLPIIVGLVTKATWSPAIRAVVLMALASVTSVLQAVLVDGFGGWVPIVMNAIITLIVGIAAHFGVWKPTGVSEAALSAFNK